MTKTAKLVRMKLPDHECPFGLKAKALLEDAGYDVDDQLLTSREEVDAYQQEQGVSKTPQVFIEGERIGGSESVERYLQEQADS